ncbi:11240_t:CDS:2 [Dentiscutata heterogama]|uniref:11240_t:CDS:1 n=1 Tax=Dentiscutata heterogama TaxID=1316150 RepID=A0ACA9KHJ7_9GLOM|nr:11240_t:CDS:2 [Dentiscutata heterogama]
MPISKSSDERKQHYIVVIKSFQNNDIEPTVATTKTTDSIYQDHISWVSDFHSQEAVATSLDENGPSPTANNSRNDFIIHEYAIGDYFRAYSAMFEPQFVENILKQREEIDYVARDSEVWVTRDFVGLSEDDIIEEYLALGDDDKEIKIKDPLFGMRVQTNPTWNLDRLDQRFLPRDSLYISPATGGRRVNVYVIDTYGAILCTLYVKINHITYATGIDINHTDFQGRASWGISIIKGTPNIDEYGHGTHVAGIIAGKKYGVAKATSVIAVKALGKTGTGSWSDVIAGMSWVAQQHKYNKRKHSVVNLSLTGKYFPPANAAVKALIDIGVHVTVAAGNYYGANSCFFSPSSTPEAITTGSSSIDDTISRFSNVGACVDIFAPGQNVTSVWLNNGTRSLSGTSMASPHVAGVIALIIAQCGNLPPARMKTKIKDMATRGVLKDGKFSSSNLLFLDRLY